jgi:hypothetical protein
MQGLQFTHTGYYNRKYNKVALLKAKLAYNYTRRRRRGTANNLIDFRAFSRLKNFD